METIQNKISNDYSNRVTNEITETLTENFLPKALDPKLNHGVIIGNYMEKESSDVENGEYFKLYSSVLDVGYIRVQNGVITECSIYSTFRQGVFAIYNENINATLKSFIGRKIDIN